MAISTPPDTLMFKALIHEIREIEPNIDPIEILDYMCDESKYLAEHCEYYFFIADEDRTISEDEAYLLEWLKTMETQKAEELRYKLHETAYILSQNLPYY